MDCSPSGLPITHYLPEFAQVHVHWISDVIQPSHPLLGRRVCLTKDPVWVKIESGQARARQRFVQDLLVVCWFIFLYLGVPVILNFLAFPGFVTVLNNTTAKYALWLMGFRTCHTKIWHPSILTILRCRSQRKQQKQKGCSDLPPTCPSFIKAGDKSSMCNVPCLYQAKGRHPYHKRQVDLGPKRL